MLGIVILNYNKYDETIKCVDSILSTYRDNKIIYIIDNDSLNDSFKILKKRYNSYSFVKIISSNENGGFSKGNNIGINACIKEGCKYAIISNNDVVFLEQSILKMYDFIKKTRDAIIVGPKILKPNGNVQHSTTSTPPTYIEYLKLNKILLKSNEEIINEENLKRHEKVYSVSGCCFIIDLYKFKEIGAFDEGTFLYNEENILSNQVNKSDYSIYIVPSSMIIHEHGVTTGKENMFVNTEFLKSGFYYWKKYRKVGNIKIVLMWINFTLRWFLKSIYCKDLRSGWNNYLKSTIKALYRTIKTDYY